MNKILLGLNAVLIVAVAFLFFKVYSPAGKSVEATTEETSHPDNPREEKAPEPDNNPPKPTVKTEDVATAPTGKIAYVNIERLNEESLEGKDIITELERRRKSIESSYESIGMQYQTKAEEYQNSRKAGIASEADLKAREKELMQMEQDLKNKEIQMENLSMDLNDKNIAFRKTVKNLLIKWNQGRYDYIFSYSEAVPTMLLGNATLDVTNEVIAELNSEYKKRKSKK
jgi:outer membrane protein